jgi:hypothetical protein
VARSTAYWTANFYTDPEKQPRPGAPLRDLPPTAALRFRMLREALSQIDGVNEKVRFIPPHWKWTWEYSLPARKLCWLHIMDTGISGTFALSEDDARHLTKAKPAGVIQYAIQSGQRTGPVTWCTLEFTDRKSIDAFLVFMKKKAAWVVASPPESKVFRRSSAG